MGLIRMLLAISVVGAHSVGFIFVGGKNAVLIFYMISGYLISYVLNETTFYHAKKSFFLNRYLRIWPMYASTVILTLILGLLAQTLFATGKESHTAQLVNAIGTVLPDLPLISGVIVVVSNILIFGLDLSSFVFFNGSNLQFGTNLAIGDIPGYKLLVIPQAWTLGVEIVFYFIAPFILRSKSKTAYMFLLFFSMTAVGWISGISQANPWDYKFSFTTLYLFLLGSISQQFVSQRIDSRKKLAKAMQKFAVPATVTLVLGFQLIPTELRNPASFLLQIWFFFSLPSLFEYSKNRKHDKFIGNLSYPIYISHILIISLLFDVETQLFGGTNSKLTFILTVLASAALGFILNAKIFVAIEKVRGKIRENDKFL